MPSSPGYERNYKEEAKTAKARGEQGTGHDSGEAIRARARRLAIKKGMIKPGSKLDIDHKKPLVKGGAATDLSNLRPRTQHANRSYPRTPGAGMK
jgi:hypothetical protein